MDFPRSHPAFLNYWQQHRAALGASYQRSSSSFLPGLLPERALRFSVSETLQLLAGRIGESQLKLALTPTHSTPSPVEIHTDGRWLKDCNMVGVNIRTIGNFWNLIKYSLTLPACQSAIHLLPVWEPGVVASLYGMASWNINHEFFSHELAIAHPQLDTAAKQLKVVINLLHALGRSVGMDVIPHTDRYSEIVLANPHFFEWLQRQGTTIVDHRANLHEYVEEQILAFLKKNGAARPGTEWPGVAADFFGPSFSETDRLVVLFGPPSAREIRQKRRDKLIQFLYERGLEPVPATMAPPYRGLEVDPSEEGLTRDETGRIWRDYRITDPSPMARVFGPLTRYKLYDALDDNRNWEIDFSKPRKDVWAYVCRHYADIQQKFGFDFMRGDMSHVQMRRDGVPAQASDYYDIHRSVKEYIRRQAPHFGYFAESFLSAPGYMAYGDEIDHLELSEADTALGDLQSMTVGTAAFLSHLRWYLDLQQTRSVIPCFTLMTADKDDPRFDEFYLAGNEARLFTALFLTDLPSYMGLGFELRDPHPVPAPNEHYTKLFVFRISEGPKATHGPYVWGQNTVLFERLTRIRLLAEDLLPKITGQTTHWLLPPDPTAGRKTMAWTQSHAPRFLFVVNFDTLSPARNIKIPVHSILQHKQAIFHFSSLRQASDTDNLFCNGQHFQIDELAPGEGQIFRLEEH